MASLEITNNRLGLTSDPVHFLDSPVLVTGATLLTNGECSLASPLQVSISSEDNAGGNEQSVYVATVVQHSLKFVYFTLDTDITENFQLFGIANATRLILQNFESTQTTEVNVIPTTMVLTSNEGDHLILYMAGYSIRN